ncbi:MAG: nuclear transport factor 2 family protein [Pseudomonadota bacterium]
MTAQATIDEYCAVLERISWPALTDLEGLCAANIEFKDPFNHTFDVGGLIRCMEHMLDNMPDVKFTILDVFGSDSAWVIKWRFTGTAKYIGKMDFTGLSEVTLNADGKVARHVDYWDAGEHFLARVPVLGALVRGVNGRLKVE